jgi:hypothetical protein
MSSIIEIAARAELLRRAGHHPAREFIDRIERRSAFPTHTSSYPVPSSIAPRPMRRIPDESSAPPPVHSPESVRFSNLLSRNLSRGPKGDPEE